MEIPSQKNLAIGAAVAALLAVTAAAFLIEKKEQPTPSDLGVFVAEPRAKDLSQEIANNLASVQPPVAQIPEIKLPPPPSGTGLPMPESLKNPQVAQNAQGEISPKGSEEQTQNKAIQQEFADDEEVMARLARYGTPVTKQKMPVGGLTLWTVVSKTGNTAKLYTTADGKALFSGTVWNLETGKNVTESLTLPPSASDASFAAQLPQVVAPTKTKSNLVSGKGAFPSAFDGPAPKEIPEAIKLVNDLAGFKEGKGGAAETLYIIVDPRCPYCRRAFQQTREHVKNGATIKWIPAAALGQPETGLPLATTILRGDPELAARVLGGHEQLPTPPTDFELRQLSKNLDFMFEAFKQNNEPNPGVPVAFFIDRRTGKARMTMGLSEKVVIEDILGVVEKID